MDDKETVTNGVQEMINRLSQEGVAEGQRQAEQIVGEAEQKADGIVESARNQANEILRQAREEAEQFQAAGEAALALAARDVVRHFGSRINEGWRDRLQELVQNELRHPDVIKQMILELTRQTRDKLEGHEIEVLIPEEILSDEDAARLAESKHNDALSEFVEELIGEDLRAGIVVQLGEQRQKGLVIRVVDQKVEIDLTEETITELLSRHLLPRFRAIMRKASAQSDA